jgi:hypothetical protein
MAAGHAQGLVGNFNAFFPKLQDPPGTDSDAYSAIVTKLLINQNHQSIPPFIPLKLHPAS